MGRDVFFITRESLLARDKDDSVDIYDAREGGGFPEVPPLEPCEGEGCQGLVPGPPEFQTPASSAYEGPGNVKEPKPKGCPKGKVKRKGRCVEKQKKHKKKQKGRSTEKRQNKRAHRYAEQGGSK